MNPPLIGITTFHTLNPDSGLTYVSVTESYVQALLSVGAQPVLIPMGLPEASLPSLLARLDGVLFPGGGDLDPREYGAPADPLAENIDPERDHLENALTRSLVQSRLPFLGICRGIQVINVALGGTLYTDIRAERPEAGQHAFFDQAPRSHLAHTVEVQADSRLARILGTTRLEVNSGHHQAVRQPAPGVQVSAVAPDGVIEALELPEHRFGLAVQWHPEWLLDHPPMVALFQAFVDAAARQAIEEPGATAFHQRSPASP